MTRGGRVPLPQVEGDLVFVIALCGFSAADLGDARVMPVSIPDGLGARPGDRIEVSPEQAERWIAAGIAEAIPVAG